ncbi:vacuolar protein sorting-associated protein 8 homolog [Salmo trutta]|uniref:vacuolar protein sorting-associated protein 8 homolog n=1 Tax=Salmo trutta TaxID=8032 RepID=UPI00113022EE|nr:vacuolar protein sorting-associated protein 8 homolog [Salmo trutta]
MCDSTLLETTTSLLNRDLHWSLSHLRAAVSRGLHPRQDHCNICLQQYKRRQDSPDEIIIFSCGHLYHCQCLQRKGSGHAEPRLLQVWSCYKCISSQRGRGRVTTETGRGRSTSLAQTKVMSREAGEDGKKVFAETTLDPQQCQSWDQLRCLYRGPSRVGLILISGVLCLLSFYFSLCIETWKTSLSVSGYTKGLASINTSYS